MRSCIAESWSQAYLEGRHRSGGVDGRGMLPFSMKVESGACIGGE